MLIYAFIVALIALAFAGVLVIFILRKDQGSDKMKEISKLVHDGAMTFLNREYRMLVAFVILFSVILYFIVGWQTTGAFVIGAVMSALAGNLGMRIATKANARTAQACKHDIGSGLRVAFFSGAVMGLFVVGLGVIGITALYYVFADVSILFGFGFGASSIALFARVGGGIYTKSADVGADLVGKVEAGIPEDDPRNPAVIADNVGDNVGDVAGMGADLFESYVDSIIAAMTITAVLTAFSSQVLPLLIASAGIIASIIGIFFVRGKSQSALNRGIFASAILMIIFTYFLTQNDIHIFYATIAGLVGGIVIGLATQYYTSVNNKPVQSIALASQTGPATNILSGFSTGLTSTLVPVLAVSGVIIVAYYFAGLYGIAISAIGMLSTLGITLAADTYGPVADNAAGIAEMANMGGTIRKRAESLDAIGNTTAAIGKGFAIGSAALTAVALFAAYSNTVGLTAINLIDPYVVVGLFLGGMLPFLFSSCGIKAVQKAAGFIVEEVRRQFKNKDIMRGKKKPDYDKVIKISTDAALRNMILPAALAIISPIVVGVVLGPAALGGLLAGAIVTGFLLAVTMANSGGAWDNAKKYIESGKLGGKGSDTHKAAVIGDTVGDPFKDTSGPSLNILIKLMSIVALLFVPLFV